MEKTLNANKKMSNDDFENLFEEVAKFREANRKFLMPDLNTRNPKQSYRIIQSNNLSGIDLKKYG